MSSVVISGNTSGSVTLSAPAVAGNTVLTLPTSSGTLSTGGVGEGQTWQNVAASRALATNYTNSTGKPIALGVTLIMNTAGSYAVVTVGGISYGGSAYPNASNRVGNFTIIPSGAVYSVSISSGTATVQDWAELR